MRHIFSRYSRTRALVVVSIVGTSLSGCTFLPQSGPDDAQIRQSAVAHLAVAPNQNTDYLLLDVTPTLARYFDASRHSSLRDGFGASTGGPAREILGIGDVVQVSIFEAQAGGLFVPVDGGNAGGNYVTLPVQTVDQSGTITVPYAGEIHVAGRAIPDVQAEVQKLLANRAIEPQVIISTPVNRSRRLSVLGDVNTPTEIELSPAGERVLDVIARAGGLSVPQKEAYITIERNGRTATASFSTLLADPSENIFVKPNDTVYIDRERRTYLMFGASGLTGRFDFEDSNLTLAESLAIAGGPLDGRANPSEIYLYRVVPESTLVAAGVMSGKPIPGAEHAVVFRANLRDPSMFFAIQQFMMQDKDIIYISNAGAVELAKFLAMVNATSETAANVPFNAVVTRDSIRALGN